MSGKVIYWLTDKGDNRQFDLGEEDRSNPIRNLDYNILHIARNREVTDKSIDFMVEIYNRDNTPGISKAKLFKRIEHLASRGYLSKDIPDDEDDEEDEDSSEWIGAYRN